VKTPSTLLLLLRQQRQQQELEQTLFQSHPLHHT
jgi:hypothetical protein